MWTAFNASAAVFGGIFPALLSPSVRRTITRLLDCLSFNRFPPAAMAEPIAVLPSTRPMRTRSRFCNSHSWSSVIGLTIYGRVPNAIIPIRSFGRASMNLRVTSRTASNRVASSPPMVKSFTSIELETSSTSMMSIPLASTWVSDLPSCGLAIPTIKAARASQTKARKIRPARLVLLFPIARNGAVAENTIAARGPNLPRSHASKGMSSSNSSNHGRAKVSAWPPSQSRGDKCASFHELARFIQEETAIRRRRFIARELNQVTAIQKISEQRFLVVTEIRSGGNGIQKFDRCLSGHRQIELFHYVTSQNIRNANAELIGKIFIYFGR